jgi:hypothetical protein
MNEIRFVAILDRTCAELFSKLLFWQHRRGDGRLVMADFCGSEMDNPSFPRMTMRVSARPSVNAPNRAVKL